MVLRIAQLGQPVLRRPAKPVPESVIASAEFHELVRLMTETLASAQGVGLAAPQVFVGLRLFLAILTPPDQGLTPEVFINPVLEPLSEEQESRWEGCLSFDELRVLVPRYTRIRVRYLNLRGDQQSLEIQDFPARVVQHEADHLDGILTIDRAASTADIVKSSELEAVLSDRAASSPSLPPIPVLDQLNS